MLCLKGIRVLPLTLSHAELELHLADGRQVWLQGYSSPQPQASEASYRLVKVGYPGVVSRLGYPELKGICSFAFYHLVKYRHEVEEGVSKDIPELRKAKSR